MNRELPKPLQDALAKQMAGEVHPSADLLTAFAEHSLRGREGQRVTDHLAQCADCREVVFLACSVVEEAVGEENEWMPADAISRISPVLRAKMTSPGTSSAGPSLTESRRRWMLRWAWMPAVAAVLIVSGVLFQRRSEFIRGAPATIASKPEPTAALTQQSPTAVAAVPEPESQMASQAKAALAVPKPLAKSAHGQARSQAADTITATRIASNIPQESVSAPSAGAVPGPASPPGALVGGVPYPPSVFPTQNSFAENREPTTSNLVAKSQSFVPNPQMAKQSVSAGHTQWHITPDGHLEQRSASGNWTRVLAEQPITFHVISVVGDNVWAGGSGGALFHSSDGGQNWSKQPIGSPPDVETDTIVAIRFSDALHGVVITEGGARWSTSDGGVTWIKE
jgi:Photosynthesis system II assembly factor YCF48